MPDATDSEALISASELAKKLKRHPGTVSRWARLGLIPSMRANKRSVFFRFSDVVKAMEAQKLK